MSAARHNVSSKPGIAAVEMMGSVGDVNIRIFNNTIQTNTSNGRGIYVSSTTRIHAEIFNNLIINSSNGMSISGPVTEYNNAFYQCTSPIYGGTPNSSDVVLSASPFDSTNIQLGRYFLNTNANGGELLKDAGSDDVSDCYSDPCSWSIYPVSDASHLFTAATTFTTDKTWQPNYVTCDSGTVAIGYHHPRVDYVATQNITSNGTLTIKPGTIVSMGTDAGTTGTISLNGKLICDGEADINNGRIRFMHRGLCSAGWAKHQLRASSKPGVSFTYSNTSQSSVTFTGFYGLGTGLFGGTNLLLQHDNIFKWNSTGFRTCYTNSVANSLFIENSVGQLLMYGAYASNNSYDRNTQYGIYLYSYSTPAAKVTNCIFTNMAMTAGDYSTASCGIYEYFMTGSPTAIEQHNAFYNNCYHHVFYVIGESMQLGTLDSTDFAGLPGCNYAALLTGEPYYMSWTDFADRFYLLQDSQLVDTGDPCSGPMFSYTTDPNRVVLDTNRRDIGYHYPIAVQNDLDGLYDYQEYWLGSNPTLIDTDGDGLVDGYSGVVTLADYLAATGHNGIDDGTGHVVGEVSIGTSPDCNDTDNDGLLDYWEYQHGTNPSTNDSASDPDGDGYSNATECQNGTDPQVYNVITVTEYEYDDAGQVLKQSVKDFGGNAKAVTEYHYDVLGRKWQERKWASPLASSDSADMVTLYSYDTLGQQLKTIRKITGNTNVDSIETGDIVVENTYDSLGRITEITSSVESGVIYTTQYNYNSGGQLASVVDANGITTYSYYDTAGRVTKVVNGKGSYHRTVYDSLSRVITEFAANSSDANLMQTRSEYDNLGHVTRRAVMANPNSSVDVSTSVDNVIDYSYYGFGNGAGQVGSQIVYYGGTANSTALTTYEYDQMGRLYLTTDPLNNTVRSSYDSSSRVTRRVETDINPLSAGTNIIDTTDYIYTSQGQLHKEISKPSNPDASIDSSWQKTLYAYDAMGNRTVMTSPDSIVTQYTYNSYSQLTKTVADYGTSRINQTTEYGYDRNGRQNSITGYTAENGIAQTTSYTLDDLGRVKQITYPDTYYITYVYNPGSKVTQRTDQLSNITNYVYDHAYNMVTKSVPAVSVLESFSYDGLGRMLTANKTISGSSMSLIEYAYNALGKVIDSNEALFAEATKRHVDYSYDQAGYLTSMVYPDGNTVTITPDPRGRIGIMLLDGTNIASYQYVGTKVAQRITGPNITYQPTYDNLGRILECKTDVGSTNIVHFDYTYEPNSNDIATQTYVHHGDRVSYFSYDQINRLTRADYNDMQQYETFAMDDLGNRSSVHLKSGAVESYNVNNFTNGYNSVAGQNLAYDHAGNMLTDPNGYVYTYDYENRLLTITKGGVTKATYVYDALGRRIQKVDTALGTTIRYYYNTNWQVLCEKNAAGTTQRWYVYGNYIDEPLVKITGLKYYYVQDHLYSTVALLSITGTVIERYEYDAYGYPSVYSGTFVPRATPSAFFANQYLFTGRNYERYDGGNLWLQYSRNRYYSYTLGRWLTRDPLGIVPNILGPNPFSIKEQCSNGMNLYEYCHSNPLAYSDTLGLLPYSQMVSNNYKIYRNAQDYPKLGDWQHGEWNSSPWLRYLFPKYVANIFARAEASVAGGYAAGLSNAAEFLQHYLGNTGTTMYVDYRVILNESEDARDNVKISLSNAMRFSEKIAKLNETSNIIQDGYSQGFIQDSMDWQFSIQTHYTFGKGAVRKNKNCCYSLQINMHLRDNYEFENKIKYGGIVLDPEMNILNLVGIAQHFRTSGSHSLSLCWYKGHINEALNNLPQIINGSHPVTCKP